MKSTATSPAIVAILFFLLIVCILALIWLPIKGIWWLYNSRVAAQKQVVAVGQQWMQEVGEAFAPIPAQEEAVAVVQAVTGQQEEVTVVEEIDMAVEAPIEEISAPTAVETLTTAQEDVPDLQQIINELRQLPRGATKRRQVWTAICKATQVSGGTKFRDSDPQSQATFLMHARSTAARDC
jgi:hypothetical protein